MLRDLFDLRVGLLDFHFLFLGNHHVYDSDRAPGTGSFLETKVFEIIERYDCPRLPGHLVASPDDIPYLLLTHSLVDEPEAFRPDFIEANTPRRGDQHLAVLVSEDGILPVIRVTDSDPAVTTDLPRGQSVFHLGGNFKGRDTVLRAGLRVRPGVGEVVGSQNDILRRRCDGTPARWGENIVGRKHELPRFHLGLYRERNVHRHLVPVKVGIVGRAGQRV